MTSVAVRESADTETAGTMPDRVDLRPTFETRGLSTRVQGKRGTCSAFVLTAAIEYALAGKQGRSSLLSVEFLNWASNQATKDTEDGSFFSDLWKGFSQYGLCLEEDMPYQDHFDPQAQPSSRALERARTLQTSGLQLHWIKEWNPHHGLTAEQLLEIKQTLQRQYPVCGGFLWPKQQQWKDGVLQMCPRNAVRDGHSILIVGFRDDVSQPGGGLFLIRNTSGESRDGCLTYEYVRNYMNDAVWVESPQGAENGSSRQPQSTGELPTSPITTATDAADVPRRSRPPGWAGRREDVAHASFLFHDSLGAVVAPPVGRNRRISSNEQPRWNDANLDMNWFQPGQVLELPVLQGPGRDQSHVVHQPRRVGQRIERLEHSHLLGRPHRAGCGSAVGRFLCGGTGQAGLGGERAGPGVAHRFADLLLAHAVRQVGPDRDHERQSGPRSGPVLAGRLGAARLSCRRIHLTFMPSIARNIRPRPGQDYMIADLAGSGQFVGTVMSVTHGPGRMVWRREMISSTSMARRFPVCRERGAKTTSMTPGAFGRAPAPGSVSRAGRVTGPGTAESVIAGTCWIRLDLRSRCA